MEFRRIGNTEYFLSEEEFTSTLETYLKLKNTWLTFAIITGVLLAILLLVVIALRNRLSLAVALIKQGARYSFPFINYFIKMYELPYKND